jgi:hemoglobin
MAQTVFERAGGFATVRKVVSAFYDKVLESPRLRDYFTDVDMPRLIDHQTKFVAQMMQGPAYFSDEHLRRAHQNMRIAPEDFEEAADLLVEALEDVGVDDEDADFVREQVLRREAFIVARKDN